MNDSHDELASAWLDGELAPDERDRAEADPAVARARAELDAVRSHLAAPVEVPAELRERHLAAALESLPVAADDRAAVVPLRRRSAAGVPLLARAAAVLVVAGALGVGVATWSADRGESDDVAFAPSAEESTARTDAAGGAGESVFADGEGNADEGAAALESEEAESAADTGPVAPEEGADPVAVAAAADELLAGGERTAAELADELVERFGPAPGWGLLDGPTPSCAVQLDQVEPEAAPHVVVPLGPDGARLLAVDATGDARYVDAGTCQPSP